jgi:hypothetical protein
MERLSPVIIRAYDNSGNKQDLGMKRSNSDLKNTQPNTGISNVQVKLVGNQNMQEDATQTKIEELNKLAN